MNNYPPIDPNDPDSVPSDDEVAAARGRTLLAEAEGPFLGRLACIRADQLDLLRTCGIAPDGVMTFEEDSLAIKRYVQGLQETCERLLKERGSPWHGSEFAEPTCSCPTEKLSETTFRWVHEPSCRHWNPCTCGAARPERLTGDDPHLAGCPEGVSS